MSAGGVPLTETEDITATGDIASTRRFLTVEQVAEELNVGEPLVRALLKSGELRGIQVGARGMWRIGVTDLEDYISQAYQVTADRIASDGIPD